MKVKIESEVTQSCPTLRDPMDCNPPGSSAHGIFQARVMEWGAIAFSMISTQFSSVQLLSRVRLFVTPWTAAHQAPPPVGFSRQEYWRGVPLPSPAWDGAGCESGLGPQPLLISESRGQKKQQPPGGQSRSAMDSLLASAWTLVVV